MDQWLKVCLMGKVQFTTRVRNPPRFGCGKHLYNCVAANAEIARGAAKGFSSFCTRARDRATNAPSSNTELRQGNMPSYPKMGDMG